MRIVFISDTHGFHSAIGPMFQNALPEGDVLVHAGDLSNVGKLKEIVEFAEYTKRWKFKHKICIGGNHDFFLEKEPSLSFEIFQKSGWIYLRDVPVVIDGIKFYGSPWTPEFFDWAFMLPRGSPIMKSAWDLIHQDTDVLITHGPCYGILDKVVRDRINVGCELLLNRIREIQPKIHCFGHVHEGYGVLLSDRTLHINASICDLNYSPSNKPIVVDIDPTTKKVELVDVFNIFNKK